MKQSGPWDPREVTYPPCDLLPVRLVTWRPEDRGRLGGRRIEFGRFVSSSCNSPTRHDFGRCLEVEGGSVLSAQGVVMLSVEADTLYVIILKILK